MRIILWFTRDLRLKDNAALNAAIRDATSDKSASRNGKLDIVPVYILDTTNPQPVQGAAEWWLHHSLNSLDRDLRSAGGKLFLFRGNPADILKKLLEETRAGAVYFSRAYDPHTASQQGAIQTFCQKNSLGCRRFTGHVMVEPETLLNRQDKPFQVFTPYYNTFRKRIDVIPPIQSTPSFTLRSPRIGAEKLADWKLLPQKPNWAASFGERWLPGEKNAWDTLASWAASGVTEYSVSRDFPAIDATSGLSPHLSFGEISPRVGITSRAMSNPARPNPFSDNLCGGNSVIHYCTTGPTCPRNHSGRNLKNFPGVGPAGKIFAHGKKG